MAVEFRCPECRAKLRLTDAPEPGEEVECPKCSHVFPAPDNGIEFRSSKKKPAGSAAKTSEDDEAEEKPKPEKKPEKKAAGPKKRRVRKKEVNKTLLYSVAGGGVALVIAISCLLFWYFSRVPIPFQMMAYLPEDSKLASGVNVGHIQKYAEFAKTVQQASNDKVFWKAGDVMKTATGAEMDYAVYGSTPSSTGFVWIIRSKKEFNPADLSKLPGAKSYSADGQTYYTADDFGGFGGMKAFAPTNRIVVFASGGIPDGQFRNMLKGNTANPDKTLLGRTKPLAKRITRGTWWILSDYPITAPPESNTGGGPEQAEADLKRVIAEHTGKGSAWGFKASAGSKDIRFEAVVRCKEAETANETAKKWKESELAKGDEGTPPKWFKAVTTKAGDQKVGIELLSTLQFTSSGDLFIVKSSVETRLYMNSVQTLVNNLSQIQPGSSSPAPKQ